MKLSRKDQERIAIVLTELAHNPFAGKKLDGDLEGFYSWRVWPYRVLYSIEKHIISVTVVFIGHRKDVYKQASR